MEPGKLLPPEDDAASVVTRLTPCAREDAREEYVHPLCLKNLSGKCCARVGCGAMEG